MQQRFESQQVPGQRGVTRKQLRRVGKPVRRQLLKRPFGTACRGIGDSLQHKAVRKADKCLQFGQCGSGDPPEEKVARSPAKASRVCQYHALRQITIFFLIYLKTCYDCS